MCHLKRGNIISKASEVIINIEQILLLYSFAQSLWSGIISNWKTVYLVATASPSNWVETCQSSATVQKVLIDDNELHLLSFEKRPPYSHHKCYILCCSMALYSHVSESSSMKLHCCHPIDHHSSEQSLTLKLFLLH